MKTVVITHEVRNYTDWRKVYEADEVNRSKAGFKTTGEYRSVDNPNLITIIGEASSEESIRKFISDPEMKAAMDKAGVVSKPDVRILNKV